MRRRQERLKELFYHEVSLAIRDIHGLNTNGILTLTDVELSGDGRKLSVFFSVFGTDDEKRRSERILTESTGFIRQFCKKRLRLKIIPEISFKFDNTPEKASRIERILNDIRAENHEKTPGS
ncbi:MAG: 30S ribosome-binding factor RbfA [Elusimicrobia bacterium]|nr:30S ribosome-binding factor RbfA [Elusimicrobiota bacterium]